jgi:hypothetical protein
MLIDYILDFKQGYTLLTLSLVILTPMNASVQNLEEAANVASEFIYSP